MVAEMIVKPARELLLDSRVGFCEVMRITSRPQVVVAQRVSYVEEQLRYETRTEVSKNVKHLLARARVMTKFPLAVLGLMRKAGYMVPFAV